MTIYNFKKHNSARELIPVSPWAES